MKNIKLTLQYDGTRYQGWQRSGKNKNLRTISEKITDTLERITGEEPELFCAVRTEPGVHASCQTVNFKTAASLSPSELRRTLNHYLPLDIAVLSAEEVPERFHSVLHLRSVTYTYFLLTGPVPDPFRRKYTCHYPYPLDISAMESAADALCGVHDFQCFSSGKTKKGTEKKIQDIQICPSDTELAIRLTGNAFLHQMPGRIIGTLLEIGRGTRLPSSIPAIFSGQEVSSQTAPLYALHLTETQYKDICS